MIDCLCVVFLQSGYFKDTRLELCFADDSMLVKNILCEAVFGEDICLICPVDKSETEKISWLRNGILLYIGNKSMKQDENILQNTCPSLLSSIQVHNISFRNINDVYTCFQRTGNRSSPLKMYNVTVIGKLS